MVHSAQCILRTVSIQANTSPSVPHSIVSVVHAHHTHFTSCAVHSEGSLLPSLQDPNSTLFVHFILSATLTLPHVQCVPRKRVSNRASKGPTATHPVPLVPLNITSRSSSCSNSSRSRSIIPSMRGLQAACPRSHRHSWNHQ